MTKELLEGLARQALNLARTDREIRGWPTAILLATYYEGEDAQLHRMESVEQRIQQQLGKGWLSNGAAKDAAFGMLRTAMDVFPTPPDAFVMVTQTNMFRPTAKTKALPLKEQKRMTNRGADELHRLSARGFFSIVDSFTSVAQSPELVCICTQEADDLTHVNTMHMPQEDFGGRVKMFGRDRFDQEVQ